MPVIGKPRNVSLASGAEQSFQRKRAREIGITIGDLDPGPLNAITDIEGIKVGHTTLVEGEGKGAVRTGVTVILPNNGKIQSEHLFASVFTLNGWGEMTGIAPLEHSGLLRTPIFLTGTYNVGIVYDAALSYLSRNLTSKEKADEIAPPVVAECFDYFLSDTVKRAISREDVFQAIRNAKGGPVKEGAVGGGTGMVSFDFKGGIGTSSRLVPMRDKPSLVAVLVMANTADREQLRIDGVPVGKEIKGYKLERGKSKSIILVAATDAPLLPFQLKKLAKRVALGLSRTGAISSTGSGDIILAFSSGNKIPKEDDKPFGSVRAVNDFFITPLYKGAVEATQEAVINALFAAKTLTGRDGNTAYGLPLDQVKAIMKKYKRLKEIPEGKRK